MGRNKKTDIKFIKEAISVHGNKYSYENTKYLGANTKTVFFCNKHGRFEQTPNVHLRGHGCPKCGIHDQKRNNLSNTNFFIQKAKEKHGDQYDYSKVKYVRNTDSVKIICIKHGEFKEIAKYHLDGNGCPFCNKSKGEHKINEYLISKNISFEIEKRFDERRNKLILPFNFYIEKYNQLIKYGLNLVRIHFNQYNNIEKNLNNII